MAPISTSISSISEVSSQMSLMICFNSKEFVGISDPIEFLATLRNIIAVSFSYLPLELLDSGFVSLVRCADATTQANENSDNKAYTDAVWSVGTSFSNSGKRMQTSLVTEYLNFARSFTLSKH